MNEASDVIVWHQKKREVCNKCAESWPYASKLQWREAIIAAYGGFCVCCGIEYMPYLQIDHIDGGGRASHGHVLGNLLQTSKMYKILRQESWPPVVQVLCANCHFAKTIKAGCSH